MIAETKNNLSYATGAPARDNVTIQTAGQHQLLFDNTAPAERGTAPRIEERQIANVINADPAYGEGMRQACARFVITQHE